MVRAFVERIRPAYNRKVEAVGFNGMPENAIWTTCLLTGGSAYYLYRRTRHSTLTALGGWGDKRTSYIHCRQAVQSHLVDKVAKAKAQLFTV